MRLKKAKSYLISNLKSFHKGFSLVDTIKADDLNLQVVRLLHQKSGAMVYNIITSNKDNTFAPIVKTLPENDTGCPHILQHLACCGSQKYPIRDPFFNMLRRSVNTYMNAWTGDDFTAYPFSSANPKDFRNLYKVYLDMSLKPLLNELDFRQEGWRYEINQKTGQKQLKGIVFNEMKGAYQNPQRQLAIQMASKLFSKTPFGYDSGGKPESIVKLSYDQVKNMHEYYYHPSNMSFYYYGDADIKQNLTFLQEEYLHRFNYQNTTENYIKKTKQLMGNMPKKLNEVFNTVYSATAETPSVLVCYNVGYLQQTDPVDVTCLNILAYLLFQTNQAIFHQQFIQSKLADSIGTSGLNTSSVLSFGFSLKNVSISSEQILKRAQKCFESLADPNINLQRLQQYEIQQQLKILTPKQTEGIKYLMKQIVYMANRLPLTHLTNVRSNLKKAISKLKNPSERKQLIEKYFCKNVRKIVVRQQPNKSMADDYSKIIGLQVPDPIIKQQQVQLKARQQSKQQNSIDCLPKLSLTDLLPSKNIDYQTISQGVTINNQNVRDLHVKIQNKDLVFVRLVFGIDMNKQSNFQLLKFLDIWRYSLQKGIAVKGMSNKQLSSKLNLCSNNFKIKLQKGSPDKHPSLVNIVFSATCLKQTLPNYIELLNKIINQPQFKKQDIDSIFRSYKSQKVQELLDGSVMQYCLDYGSSLISKQGKIFNAYQLVTQGIQVAEVGQLPKQFELIHKKFQKQADITVIQHSKEHTPSILQKLNINFDTNKPLIIKNEQKSTKQQNVNRSIAVTNAYDVNFCSQVYPAPAYYSKQHANMVLLSQILEQDYLHPKIRQKGGAYGARSAVRQNGTLALYSYMDPYSSQTYAAFQESIQQLLNSQLTKQRIQQVKIKILGEIDSPKVPQIQCYGQILKSYTNQERNKFREYIMQANEKQVIQTGRKYLRQQLRSRVMFGKDVPKQFIQQKLKIPKQTINEQQQASQA